MSDFLNEYAGQGYEKITNNEKDIPFLKIFQSLNPQCIKGNEEYMEEAEPGLFYNSINQKIYGNKVNLIPLDFEPVWIEWKLNRGGFVGIHKPGSIDVDKSDFSKWVNVDTRNNIVETYLYYCLIEGHFEDGIVIFSLSSSGIKQGKKWNTFIENVKLNNGSPAPFFSSVWNLETKLTKNDLGSWYQIDVQGGKVKRERFITQEEFSAFVKPSRELLKDINTNMLQIENKSDSTNQQEIDY